MIKFEWDIHKATSNLRKHKISFKDAETVFYDPNAKIIDDPDHSENEQRFILLEMSKSLKVLIVCHCYRLKGQDEIIRIISARKADRIERKTYGGKK